MSFKPSALRQLERPRGVTEHPTVTICRECGTNLNHWPSATIGRCTPAGHYLITRRAPRLPKWSDEASCQGCASKGAIVAHYDSCPAR